jgi:hypothetical protein
MWHWVDNVLVNVQQGDTPLLENSRTKTMGHDLADLGPWMGATYHSDDWGPVVDDQRQVFLNGPLAMFLATNVLLEDGMPLEIKLSWREYIVGRKGLMDLLGTFESQRMKQAAKRAPEAQSIQRAILGSPIFIFEGRVKYVRGVRNRVRETLRLRPHHLLCHRLFSGNGYDDRFIANMRAVIMALEEGVGKVVISPGCDDICAACPHGANGTCNFSASVEAKDESAARFFGLPQDCSVEGKVLAALLDDRIATLGAVGQICGRCEWSEACDRRLRESRSYR